MVLWGIRKRGCGKLIKTATKLEKVLQMQRKSKLHHTIPKQHGPTSLTIIDSDKQNDINEDFQRQYENLYFPYLDKATEHNVALELTISHLSSTLLLLDSCMASKRAPPGRNQESVRTLHEHCGLIHHTAKGDTGQTIHQSWNPPLPPLSPTLHI